MTNRLLCKPIYATPSYEIEIEINLLQNAEKMASYLKNLTSRFVIIANETTAALHGYSLEKRLLDQNCSVELLSFPDGEIHKSRQTKEQLENELLKGHYGRDTCLIALGGGVTTDLTGYIAATYCRGVPFVAIPTTLLGMVDASLGGKTGVNVLEGKNMIGCIYQPRQVWIDPLVLKTLPPREIRNGFVEMIKHGLIASSKHFNFLETHYRSLLNLDMNLLTTAIYDSCKIKKTIIEEDPYEKGKRRLLNLGHTIGHALETLSNYAMAHGEAVAVGIIAEAHLAMQQGLSQASFDRIKALLQLYGLPYEINRGTSLSRIKETMIMDKKSLLGKPRFVILTEIGCAKTEGGEYCFSVSDEALELCIKHVGL